MDAQADKRTSLPLLWTGSYGEGGFPRSMVRRHYNTPVSTSPPSPQGVHFPEAMLPRHHGEQVTELGRSLVQTLGRRTSAVAASPGSSAVPSPLSGAFNALSVGCTSAYAANTSLLLSGVRQGDVVESPLERRMSATVGIKHPQCIFVTAVAARGNEQAIIADGKVTINATVFPRSGQRTRFKMSRTFSLRKVHESIPGPARRPSATSIPSSPDSPRILSAAAPGRRSSMLTRRLVPRRSIAADMNDGASMPPNTRPISWPHARLCLPILSSLMLSGQLHDGDRIEIPMPCPEAWLQTWTYLCTAQGGEVLESMERNILYLGGKLLE